MNSVDQYSDGGTVDGDEGPGRAIAGLMQGDGYEAEQAVQRAIRLDPQDKYMRLLSNIRDSDFARWVTVA
jgi:hypothetical protein